MSTLDDWLMEAGRSLALPPGPIPADLRNELLDLTRDVAHGVARVAGPLTCYLVGVAVGRGAAPGAALAALTDLVKARTTDADTGPAGAGTHEKES
ncbi:DUF6457 domain-containing protein [Nakamurella alba]|uniref:DUF6457 domain-containing protein n=1 Tax=Nakamurella alba TaxID=2665158 RepID=UPI0018AB6348|nr:DUF6457 domain-containing protein [Nakamurella alba]